MSKSRAANFGGLIRARIVGTVLQLTTGCFGCRDCGKTLGGTHTAANKTIKTIDRGLSLFMSLVTAALRRVIEKDRIYRTGDCTSPLPAFGKQKGTASTPYSLRLNCCSSVSPQRHRGTQESTHRTLQNLRQPPQTRGLGRRCACGCVSHFFQLRCETLQFRE